MDLKKLIIPLIVLALLGGLVVWKNSGKEEISIVDQAKFESLNPPDLNVDTISKLELYAGATPEEKVVLVKTGEAWRVTSHFNAPAKTETVDDFIKKLLELRGEFRTEAADDAGLAEYELQDAQAFHVAAYTSAEGDAAMNLLAGKAADYRTVFLRKTDDMRIFVEGVNLRSEAGIYGEDAAKAPEASKWLDKDIVKIEQSEISKLSLVTPDKILTVEKQEVPNEEAAPVEPPAAPAATKIVWAVTEGGMEGATLDQATVSGLLSKLKTLTATDIVDPAALADYGLDAPAFKFAVTLADREVVLEGGRPDPAGNGYLRVAGAEPAVVYEMSSYSFDPLFPKGSDFFDLPGWTIAPASITAIEVQGPEGLVQIVKEGDNWTVASPKKDLEVQSAALVGLTSAISMLKPAEVCKAGVAPGTFDTTVTVTHATGVNILQVGGSAKSMNGRYARLDDRSEIIILRNADVERILVTADDVYLTPEEETAAAPAMPAIPGMPAQPSMPPIQVMPAPATQ